jgi:hypothetical protein
LSATARALCCLGRTGASHLEWKGEDEGEVCPHHFTTRFRLPKKPIQWEIYRPIKGSPGAFIGIVEAPDETSALKTAIEEFGIINPEHQSRLFVRRLPGDDD